MDTNGHQPEWAHKRLGQVERDISYIKTLFPKRARRHVKEGHVHDLVEHIVAGSGSGGLDHYDYLVDASFVGVAGTVITTAGGSTAKLYATVQAALTAADADNTHRTIRINAGTYTENITVASSFAHVLTIVGEGRSKTIISGTFAYNGANVFILRDLNITGAFSAAATNAEVHAHNILFSSTVGGDFVSSSFNQCQLVAGYDNTSASHTPAAVMFLDCQFDGASAWSAGSIDRHYFVDCQFAAGITVSGSTGFDEVVFQNCHWQTAGASFVLNTTGAGCEGLIFDGCTFAAPGATPNATIYIQAAGTNSGRFVVSDCYFQKNSNVTTRNYIRCDTANAAGWSIVGNTFGKGGSPYQYLETDGGVSVIGIFVDAVIGPNSPPNFNLQADATSSNVLYIGTGVVSGAGAASVTLVPGGIIVEEDNVVVSTGAGTIDFTEPDATITTVSGTAPNQEVDVALSSYALLTGRVGGQTLKGGTADNTYLSLQSNSVDLTDSIKLLSPLQVAASPNNTIRASDATDRITITSGAVTVTGSLNSTGVVTVMTVPATTGTVTAITASANIVATGNIAYTGLKISPAITFTAGSDNFNGIDISPNITGSGNGTGYTIRGLRGQATVKVSATDTGVVLAGLGFEALASMQLLTAGTSATVTSITGVDATTTVSCTLATGGVRTMNVTTVRGLWAHPTISLAGTGVNVVNITDWVGMDADWISSTDTDLTVTNFYGVRINASAVTSPRVTNRFGVYEAGSGAAGDNHGNRFKSNTQFGSTTGQFGGGDGVIGVTTATVLPVGLTSNGVVMFVRDVAGVKKLHVRNSAGTEFVLGG